MKDEMLPHARNPFQLQDLHLVSPSRGHWNERPGREPDNFGKALRGKERDIRKGFVSLLSKSVVPEHDVQEPARFAQPHNGSDLSRREWSGGVDDQFARAQADDRHDAAEVCSKKPERIGQHPNVFSEFFHERRLGCNDGSFR